MCLTQMPSERVDSYLCQALTEILRQVANSDSAPVETPPSTSAKLKLIQDQQQQSDPAASLTPQSPPVPPPSTYCIVFLNEPLSRRISCESEVADVPQDNRPHRTEEEIFHRNLRLLKLDNINQVESVLKEKLESFKGHYGVLQFLYSAILTKVRRIFLINIVLVVHYFM